MDNARMGKIQRTGDLPSGCSRIAASNDGRALVQAFTYGNRATRRAAVRKLAKLAKKGLLND